MASGPATKGAGPAAIASTAANGEHVSSGSAPTSGPRLAVTVRPHAGPPPEVDVLVEVSAPAISLVTWTIACPPERVHRLKMTDDSGALAPAFTPSPAGAKLEFDHAPAGTVRLSYAVDAVARPWAPAADQVVLSDRFRGSGEGLLLLPTALDDTVLDATVSIDPHALGVPLVASSLGVGSPREAHVRGRFLRFASFLAGSLGTAILDAPEGHDEAAWSGYTAFDPRPVVGELAQVRTGFGQFFRSQHVGPMTYLLFVEPRPQGSFAVSARADSLIGRLGSSEPWTAPLRIGFAQQLMHSWIGGVLWVGPTDSAHEAESWWFTDGFAHYMTVRLLARFELLDPNDVRDDLEGQVSTQALSPFRDEPNATLAAHAQDDGVHSLLAARGALYAAHLNETILAASHGARSIDRFIQGLFEVAVIVKRALREADWEQTLGTEVAPEEVEAFSRFVLDGKPVVLSAGALGRCFRAAPRVYTRFDLGFDEVLTRESSDGAIKGLRDGGPAARAGLRATDVLETCEYRAGHPEVAVKLTVRRAGKAVVLTYQPRGATRRAQGWDRVPGVADERCRD
jgi:hypothetical protein